MRGLLLQLIIVLALISGGCAKKGTPDGGPPDLKPPEVLRTVPAAGDVDVPRVAAFTVEFSELVEPSTVIPALVVSPPLAGTPSLKWSGRIVRITWPDSLRSDVTYRFMLGAKLADRHQNRIKESVTIAFSTGAQIDSCRIRGMVWTPEASATALDVLAFRLDSTRTWPYPRPDFVTQTGTDGQFDLPYLPPGLYRVLVLGDRNRNVRPDQNELIAIDGQPVDLTLHPSASGLRLFAHTYDTTAFAVNACSESPDGAILLGLTHSADTSHWHSAWLTLTDSATGETLSVTALAPPPPRFNVVAVYDTQFMPGGTYQIATRTLDSGRTQSLFDITGQIMGISTCRLNYTMPTDSTGPKVVWTSFPTADNVSSPTAPLHIGFNKPVDTVMARDILGVYDSLGTKLTGTRRWLDARHLTFAPDSSWPQTNPPVPVVITLDSARLVDTHGNRGPSQTRTWTFRPLTQAQMGAVSGHVEVADSAWNGAIGHLDVRPLAKGSPVTLPLTAPGAFEISLPSGRWLLGGYLDLNGDGHWEAGTLDPYSPAEPRTIMSDTLEIRARFTVEGAVLKF